MANRDDYDDGYDDGYENGYDDGVDYGRNKSTYFDLDKKLQNLINYLSLGGQFNEVVEFGPLAVKGYIMGLEHAVKLLGITGADRDE